MTCKRVPWIFQADWRHWLKDNREYTEESWGSCKLSSLHLVFLCSCWAEIDFHLSCNSAKRLLQLRWCMNISESLLSFRCQSQACFALQDPWRPCLLTKFGAKPVKTIDSFQKSLVSFPNWIVTSKPQSITATTTSKSLRTYVMNLHKQPKKEKRLDFCFKLRHIVDTALQDRGSELERE